LEYYLLDGGGDSDLTSELTALGHLIKDHVEAHYHDRAASGPVPVRVAAISKQMADLPSNAALHSRLPHLLLDPRTRHVALRSLIAGVVFTALDVHTAGDLSLLPRGVVDFVRTAPTGLTQEATPHAIKAMNAWRRLSGYLLNANRQERSPLSPPPEITMQISELQSTLEKVLAMFTIDGHSQGPALERLIFRCANLGYALFSHPCEWRFLFRREDSTQGSGPVVLLPGLERLSGPDGEPYRARHVIVQPTMAQDNM
ncbi:hypothetical protein B0T16DRAFT_338588, partial [Cercophora newfieldiana]